MRVPLFAYLAILVFVGASICHRRALATEIWFAPPDSVMQRNADFSELAKRPESWAGAARGTQVFAITINYLLRAPLDEVDQLLDFLKSNRIKLAVSMPALPLDKARCGYNSEGAIWPGEAEVQVRGLLARDIRPDFISFDLPLTSGHLDRRPTACHLSVKQTASQLAQSVRSYRRAFSNTHFVDAEVPTGIPPKLWRETLAQWLQQYRAETGEELYGLSMDVWWAFQWREAVRQTIDLLASRQIRAGIYVGSDGGRGMTAEEWVADAKRNACNLSRSGFSLDYVVIANWTLMAVKNVPQRQPSTLTNLLGWYQQGPPCDETR